MSVARLWDGSAWVPAFVGARGPSGVVSSNTPPEDTTVLWADTSEAGDAVVPTGGTTGQSLVKASSSDYDTEWVDGVQVVNHGATAATARPDAATVYWKGTVAPDNGADGDLWYDSTGD